MDDGACSYRRFLEGDESAVAEIMERSFLNLVFFIDGYVHDVHEAEDIAMDVMSDLFVKRRYNFRSSLKTYLFMLGKSRAIDRLRRRRTRAEAPLEEAERIADERADLESRVLEDERSRELNEALRSLPGEQRTAVRLVYFERMTYEETARVMGKTRKQIDNLLSRAKEKLRGQLGAKEEAPAGRRKKA